MRKHIPDVPGPNTNADTESDAITNADTHANADANALAGPVGQRDDHGFTESGN